MCTVSFVPSKGKIFLTSNRDEYVSRGAALFPICSSFTSCSILFPKDSQGGGSWIGLCSNGNAGVLLNGAFEKHETEESYRKSRGLVFLEIINSNAPVQNFSDSCLVDIEPFTLIIWQQDRLYECRWDGEKKYVEEKDACIAHLWSSSTLYDADERREKEERLFLWNKGVSNPTSEDVMRLHKGLLREEPEVQTLSISCMEIGKLFRYFTYMDLQSNQKQKAPLHKLLSV